MIPRWQQVAAINAFAATHQQEQRHVATTAAQATAKSIADRYRRQLTAALLSNGEINNEDAMVNAVVSLQKAIRFHSDRTMIALRNELTGLIIDRWVPVIQLIHRCQRHEDSTQSSVD